MQLVVSYDLLFVITLIFSHKYQLELKKFQETIVNPHFPFNGIGHGNNAKQKKLP
jgi:hypothetical protein